MPCPAISKESLNNPERYQHFPSPKPILIGEAVQAVEYRIGIFFPVQQVVEVYPYAEFPEGVVKAGIEQGEGLMVTGGDFLPGDVCGEGQFQGYHREEGQLGAVHLRADALILLQVTRECPGEQGFVIQFQERAWTGIQMKDASEGLSVIMDGLSVLEDGILAPRVGGLQGYFGLQGTEVFTGFSRSGETVGMMGDEVLCPSDLFGGNLLAVHQVVPSAAMAGIQVEEPHFQGNLKVIVQVGCQCLCI